MTEQAPRAGDTVDGRSRGRNLVVGEQIPRRIIEGRAREERHLGIAVDVDLLDEVLELVAGEVVVAGQRGIPVLAGVLREVEEAGLAEIVPYEVDLIIEDELAGEPIRAPVGHARRLRLGAGHVENGPEDLVHGEERRSHARRAGEEASPVHAMNGCEALGQILDARFDPLLLAGLGEGIELSIGDDLGGHRRCEGGLGGGGALQLLLAQEVWHHEPPLGCKT